MAHGVIAVHHFAQQPWTFPASHSHNTVCGAVAKAMTSHAIYAIMTYRAIAVHYFV